MKRMGNRRNGTGRQHNQGACKKINGKRVFIINTISVGIEATDNTLS